LEYLNPHSASVLFAGERGAAAGVTPIAHKLTLAHMRENAMVSTLHCMCTLREHLGDISKQDSPYCTRRFV